MAINKKIKIKQLLEYITEHRIKQINKSKKFLKKCQHLCATIEH